MTYELFYDTETTGLPNWSAPSEDPSQPHVTQLAAQLVETATKRVVASMNFIIRPDGWMIPEELQELTGITMELANDVGVSMRMVLPCFLDLWMSSTRRVGHNESFDMRMIRIELMRNSVYTAMADEWKAGVAYCTQSNSVKIVNLPPTEKMKAAKRNGPKPPNLGEAYEFFTGKKLEGAHNAMVDVEACKAVYFGIIDHAPATLPL
jgi:DNA polymerase-3 subunit epsilon